MSRKVDYSFKNLTLLPNIARIVTHLNICSNKLTQINIELPNLLVLNTSFNQLVECKLLGCKSLLDIHVGFNPKLIDLELPKSVRILNICGCPCKIDFKGYKLQSLQCDNDPQIEEIPTLQVLNRTIVRPFLENFEFDKIQEVQDDTNNYENLDVKELLNLYEKSEIDFPRMIEILSIKL
eukprot:NODE_337_length_9297_cov_0.873994.p7 type:complete len:180 gc:universal NODE_337_length_9297_cov_0.873994:2678-3217(+)